MNIISRVAIFFIFLLIIVCVIEIYNKRKRANASNVILMLSVIVCFLLILILCMNRTAVYKSPEDLFNNKQKGQIEAIIHGNDSCMVYYKNQRNIYSYVFLIKSPGGYKLLDASEYIKVFDSFNSQGSIEIFLLKGTDDYYLFANTDPETDEINVFYDDSREIRSDVIKIDGTSFFCGFIDDFSRDMIIRRQGTVLCLQMKNE